MSIRPGTTGGAGAKLNSASASPDSPATSCGLFGTLGKDGHRLFATRLVRLFAYGFLSVVLVLYLVEAGLSEARIGLLLTLLGDTAVSLWLTTTADRFGRKRTLVAGPLFASPALMGVPFFLAGGLKIVYDLVLWRSFRSLKPPEEP
jgi:MFS family permease